MSRLNEWLNANPKRFVVVIAAALVALGLALSQIGDNNSNEVPQPIPTSQQSVPNTQETLPSENLDNNDSEDQTISEELKELPLDESVDEAADREATDTAMVVVRTFLSYSYQKSPRVTISDLRVLTTDELFSELSSTVAERDWDSIIDKRLERVIDATDFEFLEYSGTVPTRMIVSVNIYDIVDGNYPSEPTAQEKWDVSLELGDTANYWLVVSLSQAG